MFDTAVVEEPREVEIAKGENQTNEIYFNCSEIEIRYKKGRHKLGTVESSHFPEVLVHKQSGVRVPAVILREAF